MILLDTNVVSEVMRLAPDAVVVAWLNNQPEGMIWTTSITVLEIRTGIELLVASRRQSALSVDFERFLDTDIRGRVVGFHADAAHVAASITADRRRASRSIDLRDTIIASIALTTGASLATRNTRHFDDLSITLIDPWSTT